MDQKTSKSLSPIGFLNAVESPELGLLGGYLVVSAEGRPLEFRCTTPVRASRAQEILYGATLSAHLHSDVIGLPLLTGARLRPPLVIVPDASWRQLAWNIDAQIVQLTQAGSSSSSPHHPRDDRSGHLIGPFSVRQVDGQTLEGQTLEDQALEESTLTETTRVRLEYLYRHVQLDEPFERIRLALKEVVAASATEVEPAGPYDAAA